MKLSNYRPITSVAVRTLHRILANRLKVIKIDPRQRGLDEADVCADNTLLLDNILRYHREKFKTIYLASIDMRKAFDSVTFHALHETIRAKVLPAQMIEDIINNYKSNKSIIQHGGWNSEPLHPTWVGLNREILYHRSCLTLFWMR